MNTIDKPIPQDINIVFKVDLQEIEPGKVSAGIPKELRLTPEAFNFIAKMIDEQGLQLVKLNIASVHTQEVKDLPNVNLVDQQEEE